MLMDLVGVVVTPQEGSSVAGCAWLGGCAVAGWLRVVARVGVCVGVQLGVRGCGCALSRGDAQRCAEVRADACNCASARLRVCAFLPVASQKNMIVRMA